MMREAMTDEVVSLLGKTERPGTGESLQIELCWLIPALVIASSHLFTLLLAIPATQSVNADASALVYPAELL